MVGATVQQAEPKLLNLASDWEITALELPIWSLD
jgi:hypothetical protein